MPDQRTLPPASAPNWVRCPSTHGHCLTPVAGGPSPRAARRQTLGRETRPYGRAVAGLRPRSASKISERSVSGACGNYPEVGLCFNGRVGLCFNGRVGLCFSVRVESGPLARRCISSRSCNHAPTRARESVEHVDVDVDVYAYSYNNYVWTRFEGGFIFKDLLDIVIN